MTLDGSRVIDKAFRHLPEPKRRATPRRLEEALQVQIAQALTWGAPALVWYAVPNGGHRHKAVAGALKAQGVKAGVPDLAFVLPGGRAAFVELKVGKNGTSSAQDGFLVKAADAGALWAVCRSLEEVVAALSGWGVNVRVRG